MVIGLNFFLLYRSLSDGSQYSFASDTIVASNARHRIARGWLANEKGLRRRWRVRVNRIDTVVDGLLG